VITELIEWLVFDNDQELSLLSLITLLAGALLTILYKSTLNTSNAPFDAYESAVSFDAAAEEDPTRSPLWRGNMALLIFGSVCGLLQVIFGGAALYTGDKTLVKMSAVCGLIGPTPSLPVAISPDNHFYKEQWANWTLNTVASTAQLVDAFRAESSKVPGFISTLCGMIMLGFAVGAHRNHTPDDDRKAAFDLVGQLIAVVTNMTPGLFKDPKTQGGVALVAGSGAFGVGIAAIVDSFQRPQAELA
jgi:hypothetical protein